MKFRYLKADEIECRVGVIKQSGCSLLLFKDARVDMNILDETVSPENWQRDHKELKNNIYSGVGIWDKEKNQWIWKWDAGAESNTEAVKGEASDSFKRACFNWGIGRELYTTPFIWISLNAGETYENGKDKRNNPKYALDRKVKFHVSQIIVKDGVIVNVQIKDQNGIVRYGDGYSNAGKPKVDSNRKINAKELEELEAAADKNNVNPESICSRYNVNCYMDLTHNQWEKAMAVLSNMEKKTLEAKKEQEQIDHQFREVAHKAARISMHDVLGD